MARLITFAEAQTRFANLATTGISIGDAIQEAVDSIYESGRWPGTTIEVPVESTDFELDSTGNFYLLKFDEWTYDGMIGFRCEHRGYSIVDQSMLYRNGTTGGGLNIVDFGTVTEGSLLLTITSGSCTPTDGEEIDFAGKVLNYAGIITLEGIRFDLWSESGTEQVSDEFPVQENEFFCTVSLDKAIPNYYHAGIQKFNNGSGFGFELLSPIEFGRDPSSFDWGNSTISGGVKNDDLVVTNDLARTAQKRTYRMPYGFNPEMGPYWALMKKEPPQLTANDYIPVNSVRALKYAILAICYEYVNDDGRATTYWSLFDRAMQSATRQTAGPKNYFVGVRNTMSVKPTQFQ